MATARKHTRTETREVTTYTLELSASERDTLSRHLEGSRGTLFNIRLALVDPDAQPDPAPLAVGDRVRILAATHAEHLVGALGVLESTTEDHVFGMASGDPVVHRYRVGRPGGDTLFASEVERAS